MLDIKFIRKNAELIEADLRKRGDLEKIDWLKDLLAKDKEYRELLVEIEALKAKRNKITGEIRSLIKAGKMEEANAAKKEAAKLPTVIKEKEERIEELVERIKFYQLRIPNILHESVPVGRGEEDNVVIRKWGVIREFEFEPKSHVDLIVENNWADIERAAKIAGARFYFLKGDLVILEQAILNFALSSLVKKGYIPIAPPAMMRREPYEGVTDLSDFENVMYKIEGEDLYMIATSEHPLVSMHRDEIIPEEELPIKYAGISPCYRKEAGAHGKDTKGIFRVHQFNKVEQLVICKPEESWQIHEELIKNAEEIFQQLEVPYRVVNVCTGDIGIVAAKKYDIEAWMPAQKKYREVASCSNCTSYQAVRSNIKYGKVGGEKEFVHTLNSTAVATPRALVALIENWQQEDGSVKVPKVLQEFVGKELITPSFKK